MSLSELVSYAQIATALGTLVLAIITYRNVDVTKKLVLSSERQAASQHEALNLQNDMLLAQVTYQRLEMYWKTLAPVSEEEIDTAELVPEDLMERGNYEQNYKGKDKREALRRYLWLARVYEYLAFTHKLNGLERADPLPPDWTELWTEALSKRSEFAEINAYFGRFYPDYAKLVSKKICKVEAESRAAAPSVSTGPA